MKVTEKVVNHSQRQMKNPDSRLIVLGSPCVGKSALVVRFLTKRFIWEYDPTLECAYRHQTTVDEELVTMEILDTAGMNDSLNREGQVRWGDGFLLVYNITDRRSFEEIIQLRQYIESVRRTKNLSCVIVGNKIDLDHERQVKYSEGEKLALEMACAFFECSACDGGDNITEAFYELHREIRRRKMIEGKSRRRSSAQQVIQAFNKMFTKING